MTPILSRIFLDANKKIRNAYWVLIFFAFLFLLLFPIIILSDYYGFELAVWYQVILILIVSIICQALRKRPLFEFIGKINGSWLKELLFGLMAGALLMAIPAMLLTLFGVVQWQPSVLPLSAFASGILVMISVVLAEELLFRGFIFQRLIDGFGTWPAQVILACMFLLTHLNNPGMTGTVKVLASINIFIASILFGIAYSKTKKLGMPIGIHFMANIAQGTILGFGVSGEKEVSILTPIVNGGSDWLTGGEFGLEASIVGLFTLILVTVLLYVWYPSQKNIEPVTKPVKPPLPDRYR